MDDVEAIEQCRNYMGYGGLFPERESSSEHSCVDDQRGDMDITWWGLLQEYPPETQIKLCRSYASFLAQHLKSITGVRQGPPEEPVAGKRPRSNVQGDPFDNDLRKKELKTSKKN